MVTEVKKMNAKMKFKLIMLVIFSICCVLFCILISQLVTIKSKNEKLIQLQEYSSQLSNDIEVAKENLEQVSSPDYQELQARKNGYGYDNEKKWVVQNY